MLATQIKFQDLNTYNVNEGYTVTNEEPELFNRLLGDQQFNRGGGICSGGEVALLCLMPRCKEVVLVDHSYQSLAAMYAKLLLLGALEPRDLLAMLEGNKAKDLNAALKPLVSELPKELRDYCRVNPDNPEEYNNTFTSGYIGLLRREFNYGATEDILAAAKARIGDVTLVHGDLKDLKGTFDLFYISNAMEHSGRNKTPTLDWFEPLVLAGGLLLGTGTAGFVTGVYDSSTGHYKSIDAILPDKWKEESAVMGYRSGWNHRVLRRQGGGHIFDGISETLS